MLDDILSETPMYKSIERRGLEQERQLRLSSLRQKLFTVLEKRFPKLHPATNKLIAQTTRPDVLEELMAQLALAQDYSEVQEALLVMAASNDQANAAS